MGIFRYKIQLILREKRHSPILIHIINNLNLTLHVIKNEVILTISVSLKIS